MAKIRGEFTDLVRTLQERWLKRYRLINVSLAETQNIRIQKIVLRPLMICFDTIAEQTPALSSKGNLMLCDREDMRSPEAEEVLPRLDSTNK